MHPQVIPNPYEFLSSVKHKGDILKNVGHQALANNHWLPKYGKKILWKSVATVNYLVTNIIHNIFFCLEQMEETPTEDE